MRSRFSGGSRRGNRGRGWAMALAGLVSVWCATASIWAQGPVEPASPDIVGYVHVENPDALGQAVQQTFGSAGLAPDALRTALAATIGDLRMTLLPRASSVTIAWVRSQGDTGPAKRIVVLPAMDSGDKVYVDDCMLRTKQVCTTKQGLSFITPAGPVAWLDPLAGPLKDLHEATQATDLSFYFRAPLLAENRDAIVAALTAIHPTDPATLLRAAPLAFSSLAPAAPTAAGLRPVVPAAMDHSHDAGRILGVLLQDVDMVHIALSPTQSPLRVTLNLAARAGTPLARLLESAAPAVNPLVGFVPPDGFLRAALTFDSGAAAALASDVLSRAFPASDPQAARGQELTELAKALFGLGDQSALMLRPPKPDGTPSWLLVATPHDSAGAVPQLQTLAERSDLFAGTPKAAGGGAAPAAAHSESLAPMAPGAAASTASRSHRSMLVVPSSEMFEKFPVGRMDDEAVASAAPAGSAPPLLMFCVAGPRFLAASDRTDLLASINHVLRLDTLSPPLLSQKTFVDGANLYLDLRPAAQAAQPWSESPAPILVTARSGNNCAQVVASIPIEMLAPGATVAVPAAPGAAVAAPVAPGTVAAPAAPGPAAARGAVAVPAAPGAVAAPGAIAIPAAPGAPAATPVAPVAR